MGGLFLCACGDFSWSNLSRVVSDYAYGIVQGMLNSQWSSCDGSWKEKVSNVARRPLMALKLGDRALRRSSRRKS